MSWGRHWGRRWGGGLDSGVPFELLSARASAANAFILTFSKPPLTQSPLLAGSATKLSNIFLQRTDAAQTLTLLTVRPIVGEPTQLEYIIVQRGAAALATYEVTANPALTTPDGYELISSPAVATFFGAPATKPATERELPLSDLRNAQTSPDQLEGGLEVGSDADYLHELGAPLLKKIIQRQIFYAQGEFMHLADKEFGIGVKAKTPYTVTDIQAFQRKLKNGIAREPEVQAVSAQVTQYPDGRLLIYVKAKTNFGTIEVTEETVTGALNG